MAGPSSEAQSQQWLSEGKNKLGHDPSTPNNVQDSLAVM